MQSVLLCSTSPLKRAALEKFLGSEFQIETFDCNPLGLPAQPVSCAENCAYERLCYVRDQVKKHYDYYVAIENDIDLQFPTDACVVIIESYGARARVMGRPNIPAAVIPEKYYKLIKEESIITYNKHITGYAVTVGKLIQRDQPDIDPANWMGNRVVMIILALENAFLKLREKHRSIQSVIAKYKSYPDFPKPGILFQDIFAVLMDPEATFTLTQLAYEHYYLGCVDYVVGLESRGFFGILLSQRLNVGFIPIRKAGKLPGAVEQIEYGTEYSKDKCEIQKSIPSGSRVLIFDDLIATGGSLKAAVHLLEKLDCVVVDCCVLREVIELRDKAKETLRRSYTVLLQD